MKEYSAQWITSKKARKQRKYRANAPLHIKHKFLNAALSKTLKDKHKKNSLPVKKGDKVKIMRGSFKKQSGAISRVDMKNTRIYIEGIEVTKKNGTKTQVSIHPSNVEITELNLNDAKRKAILTRGVKQ